MGKQKILNIISKTKIDKDLHQEDIFSIGNILYDLRIILAIIAFLWRNKMKKRFFLNINIKLIAQALTFLFAGLMPIAASLTIDNVTDNNVKLFWIYMDVLSVLYFMGIIVFLTSKIKKVIANFLMTCTCAFLIFIPLGTILDIIYIGKNSVELFGLFLDLLGMSYFIIILFLMVKNNNKSNDLNEKNKRKSNDLNEKNKRI